MKRLALVVPFLVCTGLVAGCSGDDPGDRPGDGPDGTTSAGAQDPSGSPDGSPSSTVIVENGVELTPEGSELAVGETASVAYKPRQGLVGVLDITVTRLERTSFKKSFVGWDLDAQTKKASPYFVRATITNRGTTQLGERPVPLYIVDGKNTLLEATSFASEFTPCQPGSFPKKYGSGKTVKVCMVYLAPEGGELTAVSFRPTQEFEPITWTGKLKAPKPPKKDKPGKGKGNQGDGANG